jgi:phage-related protein
MGIYYTLDSYKDDDGNDPVFEFIDGLDTTKDRASLYSAIEKLRLYGPLVLQTKAFKRFNDHLFEISKGDNRIIYLEDEKHYELLHGFPKKGQKTLRKDKVIAEERFMEYWRKKKQ